MNIINIYHGDSLKAMETMEDKKYDLSICDPEYGIGADKKNSGLKKQSRKSSSYSKDYGVKDWDSKTASVDYFNELFRVSKNQIIWGVNYYPYNLFAGGRIYWNKCVSMPTYSDGELAYCSLINSIRSYTFAWHGMIQGDMKNKEERIHVTQKPVALYKWLLKNYAKPGDKIFDSHGGSMSHAIACIEMGFDLDIWELDKDYYDAVVKRIKQHVKQLDAFRPVPEINYIQEARKD